MKAVIANINAIESSIEFNILQLGFSCLLFLFLTKFYFLEYSKRANHRILRLSIIKKSVIHALFSLLPAIFFLIALNSSLSTSIENLVTSIGFLLNESFISMALSIASILAFSEKCISTSLAVSNYMSAMALACLLLACVCLLGPELAVLSIVLLAVGALLILSRMSKLDLSTLRRTRSAEDFSLIDLLNFFQPMFYGFEIFFEHSIVLYGGQAKPHLMSFSKRAFVSPLLNLSLFLLHNKFTFDSPALPILILTALSLSITLAILSRNPKTHYLVGFYSFGILSTYLYLIARNLVITAGNIALLCHIDYSKAVSLFLAPMAASPVIILSSYYHSIGEAHLSFISLMLSGIISIFISSALSAILGLKSFLYLFKVSLLQDAFLINIAFHAVLLYYLNMLGGRILPEVSLLCCFLVGANLWIISLV